MAVIYFGRYFILRCCNLCLQKEIIILFAYNSSESGSGRISQRSLILLIIVFVVCCFSISAQHHYFSLVRSTVIGGELSGDLSSYFKSSLYGSILLLSNIYKTHLILLELNLHIYAQIAQSDIYYFIQSKQHYFILHLLSLLYRSLSLCSDQTYFIYILKTAIPRVYFIYYFFQN